MGKALVTLALLGLVSTAALGAAWAADAKPPVSPLFLELLAPRPIESSEAALNQSLRDAPPAPRRSSFEGRVLPDGSVQYGEGRGAVIVSVRQGGSGSGSGVGDIGYYRRSPVSGLRTR